MPETIIRDQYLFRISGWVQRDYIPQQFFKRAQSSQRMAIQQSPCAASAFAVSDLLEYFGLSKRTHVNIRALLRDLTAKGWRPIQEKRLGAVLVWKAVHGHQHIGFCMSSEHAVSIHPGFRKPYKHHITFGLMPARPLTHILWHPKLDQPRA
ncbi:hypothetical protein KW791_03685 [Candidatus Parcubacteria bacterium]|nr:hypothetical protein [Candidatus Parcubacteria bacterium]